MSVELVSDLDCGNGKTVVVYAYGVSLGDYAELQPVGGGATIARIIPSSSYGLDSAYCQGHVSLVQIVGTTGMGFDHFEPGQWPYVDALLGLAGVLGGLLFASAISRVGSWGRR
jgi:hypothetical protein